MTQSHPNGRRHSINTNELPVLELDETEFKISQHVAIARLLTYSDIDGGTIHGGLSAYEAHETGVIGEIAVAKFLDGLTIFDVDALHRNGDGGHDFTVRETTIDVKTTATDLDVPDLIVPATPTPSADWYILTHRIGERHVRMIGMASLETVTNRPTVRRPSNRRNYWISPEELILFTR